MSSVSGGVPVASHIWHMAASSHGAEWAPPTCLAHTQWLRNSQEQPKRASSPAPCPHHTKLVFYWSKRVMWSNTQPAKKRLYLLIWATLKETCGQGWEKSANNPTLMNTGSSRICGSGYQCPPLILSNLNLKPYTLTTSLERSPKK